MENKPTTNMGKLAQDVHRGSGQMTPVAFEQAIGAWFAQNKRKVATLAGDLETAQKILVALIQSTNRVPRLLECTPASLHACILNSATTRLFPGAMQECAYVPFRNNKSGKYDATWIPMFPGLLKLMYNSGFVRSICTEVVYEADDFDFSLGSDPFVKHRPHIGQYKDRGARVCAYISVKVPAGNIIIVKGMDFIEGIRKRSKASSASDSPWNGTPDDYDAMARKTMIKQVSKFIPKSIELATAITLDDDSETGTQSSGGAMLDVLDVSSMSSFQVDKLSKEQAQNEPDWKAIENETRESLDLGSLPQSEKVEVSLGKD